MPFTSMFMAAITCGISWSEAMRMTFTELRACLSARSSMSRDGDEKKEKARKATQADIRAFAM